MLKMDSFFLDAHLCAQHLRDGDFSAVEISQLALEQIDKQNTKLQSFVDIFRRQALRQAKKADKQLAHWRRSGKASDIPAFLGVPMGIKDLEPVKWGFTRLGSRSFRYVYTPFDGLVGKKLKKSGFNIMGKLSTSEFGILPVVEPDIHPPVGNPLNLEYTAGGSSGGSASAVSSFMLPMAQGSDGAGSIRIPSSLCHLYGFKNSLKLFPTPYDKHDAFNLATIGPLAHNVRDACAMVDIFRDHYSLEQMKSQQSFLSQLERPLKKSLKIRYLTECHMTDTHSLVSDAVMKVVRFFEQEGHQVEHREFVDRGLDDFLPIMQALMTQFPAIREKHLEPMTQWMRVEGRKIGIPAALKLHQELSDYVLNWFGDTDIFIMPTIGDIPPKVGDWHGLRPEEMFEQAGHLGAFTAGFNVTAQPAASIPMGHFDNGVAFGVQIVGQRSADLLILQASRLLEQQFPWIEKTKQRLVNLAQ